MHGLMRHCHALPGRLTWSHAGQRAVGRVNSTLPEHVALACLKSGLMVLNGEHQTIHAA